MGRVLLTIETDATSVHRAFGEIRAESRAVAASIRGDFQRLGDVLADPWRTMRREAAAAAAAVRREQEKTTRAEEENARHREALTRAEVGYRTSAAQEIARENQRAEERATATTRRESQRRIAQIEREARERRAKMLEGAVQVGSQVLGGVHHATQATRMDTARVNSTLASALGEGGATARELGGLQSSVWQFAEREGMDPERLARALQASQQQFSSLSGADPTARRAALDRALSAARLANDAQTNPEEVMRLSGALGGIGSQDTVNAVLRSAIGISRRGGVELGSLSAQNLSTIQSQMAAAVANLRRENPNATEGDAQRAMVDAFTQTLAQLEVMAPRGLEGRRAGTAIRQLGSSLHDPRVQGALRTRLRREFGANGAEVSRFFDERGQLRGEFLGVQGGENFGRAITAVAGGDPDRIRSLLGRGRRQGDRGEILHANQRDMIATLAGQDARGRTGWDALGVMREGARDVTDSDLARTRAIVQGLDETNLTRTRVRGMRNTRDPSAAQRASDALADFTAEHPMLAAMGQGVGATGLFKALRTYGPGARAALQRGAGLSGSLSSRASSLAAILQPSNVEGLSGRVGFEDDAAMIAAFNRSGGGARGRAAALGALRESVSQTSVRDVTGSGQMIALRETVREGIRDGMRDARVTVDPHAAIHADTTRSTRNAPSP